MPRSLTEVLQDPGVLEGITSNPDTYCFKEAPELLITMVSWPVYTFLRVEDMNSDIVKAGIPTNFPIAGPNSYLLEILQNSINFTYKQLVPPDVSWGVRSPDGTWSGMMRQVVEKEADMGLGPFQVIQSRSQDADMTYPFFFDTLSLMVARGSGEIDPWGFLMPLTPVVWASFFIALLSISIVHLFLDRIHNSESNLLSHFGAVLFEYGQPPMGHSLARKTWKSWQRPMIGSWVLLSLLLNASYDGTLRSLMALRHIPHPIQTLRDVIDASHRKIIIEHRTSFTDIMGRVPSGDIWEIDQAGKAGRYLDLKMRDFMVYYDLVKSGGHVQIFDVSTSLRYFAQYFSETGRCDFYIGKEKFIPTMYAMVLRNNSPITAAMNARIRRVFEAGLYNFWVFNRIMNFTACENPPTKIILQDPIGFSSIWGVGVVWAAGMSMALFVLMTEIMIISMFKSNM